MSYIKNFVMEYEETKFDYKDYESIPSFIREIIEEESDSMNFSEVPLDDIKWLLNDIIEELNYHNQPESVGAYD